MGFPYFHYLSNEFRHLNLAKFLTSDFSDPEGGV